ncbi:phage-related baseplate protein [Trabulsiella guamensis ATCC 49490]|uniref:Phage-related baseplate protein n=1 Tax=Trabulsiella guamensis ATCC 49490 TaxID=1005994 RepID=A0A085ASD7_9ENTR|nr:phage baseplate assembly protein V [Trabulsiella guamensis]KFC13132.1 phage-related baseplate protein [Trabulsiella guamensis ATCC 49490]
MSSEELADLRQRVANMVRRGVISEVIPGNPVKVRVRLGPIITPPIAWCNLMSSGNFQVRSLPKPGDAVTVFSEAGDLRNGRVYPGANIDAVSVPDGEDSELALVFANGTEIRYSQDNNTLNIILAEGGKYTIKGDGTLDGNVKITKELTVMQNIYGMQQISDAAGTMSAIRMTYNGHNHRGDSGGQTAQPNQQMPVSN